MTADEQRRLLAAIGVQSTEDFYSTIPPKLREQAEVTLDVGHGYDGNRGLSEREVSDYFRGLASTERHRNTISFLGGGTYEPILPAAADTLCSRAEFVTAPPPIAPEASQGTLQALFELQSLLRRVLGSPLVAVCSPDGSTALSQSVWAAIRLAGETRRSVLTAQSLPRGWRDGLATQVAAHTPPPVPVEWNDKGTLDLEKLAAAVRETPPAAVVVASPNAFGIVEPIAAIRSQLAPETMLIVGVPDLTSLAVFESPATLGADIVCGDLQPLVGMALGGERAGFIAMKREPLEFFDGWLVEELGEKGNTRYEPFFPVGSASRRLPSGPGLAAIRAAITLSLLGRQGFFEFGTRCQALFAHLVTQLARVGIPRLFPDSLSHREGVFLVPKLATRFQRAVSAGIIPGIALGDSFSKPQSDFSNALLVCCHPFQTLNDCDRLVEVLSHD